MHGIGDEYQLKLELSLYDRLCTLAILYVAGIVCFNLILRYEAGGNEYYINCLSGMVIKYLIIFVYFYECTPHLNKRYL